MSFRGDRTAPDGQIVYLDILGYARRGFDNGGNSRCQSRCFAAPLGVCVVRHRGAHPLERDPTDSLRHTLSFANFLLRAWQSGGAAIKGGIAQ